MNIISLQPQISSIKEPNSKMTSRAVGRYLTSFQRELLESQLREDLSHKYYQRLQIMLMADDGKSQAVISKALKCSPITVRHWMLIARTGEAHNWQNSALGRPKEVNDKYLERLKELVQHSPRTIKVPNREHTYHQHRWTASLLSRHLQAELEIEVSCRHVNRLLNQMGFSLRSRDKYNQPALISNEMDERIQIRDLDESVEPKVLPTWPLGFCR